VPLINTFVLTEALIEQYKSSMIGIYIASCVVISSSDNDAHKLLNTATKSLFDKPNLTPTHWKT
jgi:hypothetical protein